MAYAGGWKVADADELNAALGGIRADVEVKAEKDNQAKFDCFQVESGAKQVVAGMNFMIKIKVGNNRFIQIKVYRSLPPISYELKSVEYDIE